MLQICKPSNQSATDELSNGVATNLCTIFEMGQRFTLGPRTAFNSEATMPAKRLRVLLISGSWPPAACGVGHYASVLGDHLSDAVEIIRYGDPRKFRWLSVFRTLFEIRTIDPDLIHIQYPTVGYERSLIPSLIAAISSRPILVTLHEYYVFKWYRAIWFYPFFLSDCLIFTNQRDCSAFEQFFGKRSRTTEVISIGSNIPKGRYYGKSLEAVGYFGLIMPNKGIEKFVHLARLAKADGFQPVLIGAIPNNFRAYGNAVLEECRSAGVSLLLDRRDEEVADILRNLQFAYLPFPDGASEKRGSLLAALINKVTVLTPHSCETPEWLRSATINASSPEEAIRLLRSFRTKKEHRDELGSLSNVDTYVDWRCIAKKHTRIYNALFEQRQGAGGR